jgi:hypothetical protein
MWAAVAAVLGVLALLVFLAAAILGARSDRSDP